ncbi:MAG: flagellar hook-basal body complex protein FliE [Acidobacteriota bacterium]
MPMPISPIAPAAAAPALAPARAPGGGEIFKDLLEGAIDRVEGMRRTADQAIERTLSGDNEELHNTILAAQRAEIAFDLFLQVRNKVTQAYQEVMRMQI